MNPNKLVYTTRRWFKLRRRVIQRDSGLCQQCLKAGKYTEGIDVDHILPMADHPECNPFDIDGLQLLCKKCHHEKTGKESSMRSVKKRIGWLEI